MGMSKDEQIAYNQKRIEEDERWCLISWAREYGKNNYYAENDDEEDEDDDAECILD